MCSSDRLQWRRNAQSLPHMPDEEFLVPIFLPGPVEGCALPPLREAKLQRRKCNLMFGGTIPRSALRSAEALLG